MTYNSIQEKQKRIRELKEALDDLEKQLAQDMESSQHEIIDQEVDRYFQAVDTKFSSLRLFWESLKNEWQQRKDNDADSGKDAS